MERVKFAVVGLLALLFLPFLGLSASVASANPDIEIIDLRDAIDSGNVELLEVQGKGYFAGPSLGAILQNHTANPLFVSTEIGNPLYFVNHSRSLRDNMIATRVFDEELQCVPHEESCFIELPAKSTTKLVLVAYSTDFEKAQAKKTDTFSLADTPKEILHAASNIAAFEAQYPDQDLTTPSQVALWRAQGRSLDEIRHVLPFSDEDRKIGNEMLEGVPMQPSTVYFRWQPYTFLCGDECIVEELSFAEAYPVPFYQTDAFAYTVIATAVATAATVTFLTDGAGAPALVPGTSSLVVLIGGGGQGAYMAGLSTIGSVIGSNAVGGAAIVNSFGAVAGLTAGVRSAAFGGVALKTMFGVSAAAYDGVLIGQNKETGELIFFAELSLPTELGSGWVRDLAESIYENEQKAAEALGDDRDTLFARYLGCRNAALLQGVETLKQCWPYTSKCSGHELSRDDLLTLSLMAYKAGEFDLFHRVVAYLYKRRGDFEGHPSLLNYLYATSLLMQSNLTDTAVILKRAIAQEPGAIEPTLLYLAYLGATNFEQSKAQIESLLNQLEKAYDDDDYRTAYSLATAYFRVGHLYAANGYYERAILHFGRAKDELNFLQKWPIFSGFMNQKFRQDIELDSAISHFRAGDTKQAQVLYDKLIKEQKSKVEKDALEIKYLCSTTPDDAEGKCHPPVADVG